MTTLTDFLLARIAEDEAAARPHVASLGEGRRWVADRLLAECNAKRAVIEAAWDDHVRIEGEWGMGYSREQLEARNDYPATVAILAAVYADHPDYDESWRP